MNSKLLVWLEGVLLVLFGVVVFLIFYVIVVWMFKYVMVFVGMLEVEVLKIIFYYSMGLLVCVFIFVVLLKKMVWFIWVNVFNFVLVIIIVVIIYLYFFLLVCNVGVFVIGFLVVGGIL